MRKARELKSFKDLRKFKIPKFYKDLGVEAMWAYVRQHYFCKVIRDLALGKYKDMFKDGGNE